MPAAKPKTNAKVEAIREIFGKQYPLDSNDSDFINYLYARRNLATVPEVSHDNWGSWRELKYIVELTELEPVIRETLDRIYERDGEKIFREVAASLLGYITTSVENRSGRRALRRIISENLAN